MKRKDQFLLDIFIQNRYLEFMELINTQQVLVDELLDQLLKFRKDICKCKRCRLDMKAWALNHLPSKYVVSERGLTHSILDSVKDAQARADAVTVVAEAINLISKRPRPGHKNIPLKKEIKNIFFLPQIVGEVYENEMLDPATGAKITLLDEKKQPLLMKNDGWQNPLVLPAQTMGFFNFWPVIPIKKIKKKKYKFFIEIYYKKIKKIIPFEISMPKRNDSKILKIPAIILNHKNL